MGYRVRVGPSRSREGPIHLCFSNCRAGVPPDPSPQPHLDVSAEELYLRAKTEKMRKKQEPSPVERRGRKPVFADVVLSDANSNDAGKRGGIELLYPNGVRILLPQGMLDAEKLMCYIKAYGE